MKASAFFIRIAVCFLLSLVPVTELENLIYSQRMELRGQWSQFSEVMIVDLDTRSLYHANSLRAIQTQLIQRGAALVLSVGRFRSLDSENGLINDFLLDPDGLVRSGVLIPKNGRDTLVQAALRQLGALEAVIRGIKSPYLINYMGPAGSILRCPLVHALSVSDSMDEGMFSECAKLKDRIVLLSDETENPSAFFTPLREMSQSEIAANALFTVVYRKPIYRAGWMERSFIKLALMLLIAFFIMYYSVLVSSVAVTAGVALIVLVFFQLLFHLFQIYIPSADILSGVMITYLVFTGYRLAIQENLQWRSIKQAQYLRELDRMKSNFLSIVSHDLKTPLAKIQAIVERLRRESQLSEDQRSNWLELFDSIESSNQELKHYITSLLNLSRIESQKVILNKKSNDINQILKKAVQRLRSFIEQKNLMIEEQWEPLFAIECDEDLVRQVFTNLVDNAIKYSPEGGKIIIRSFEQGDWVVVEVEDHGPGIPKDQLPLVFRKFSRLMRPIGESHVKGTGLGLYLSKYFIELHGGSIELSSQEGKGSVFRIRLPVQPKESVADAEAF